MRIFGVYFKVNETFTPPWHVCPPDFAEILDDQLKKGHILHKTGQKFGKQLAGENQYIPYLIYRTLQIFSCIRSTNKLPQ